jgi:NADH:ubiquinone oxidoreductase subunit E
MSKRIFIKKSGPGSKYFGYPSAQEAVEHVLERVNHEIKEQEDLKKAIIKTMSEAQHMEIWGRMQVLRDMKERLETHIKEIDKADVMEDMAQDGAF